MGAGALGISLVAGGASFLAFLHLNSLIAVTASVAITYFSLLHVLNYFPNELRRERIAVAEYTGSILQEFYFALSSTGSIFDALQVVAIGGYPYVSKKFQEIIYMTQNGQDPEQLLLNYANRQPSTALRHGLVEIISARTLNETTMKHLIDLSEFEIRGYFQEFSRELEGRILVFIGIAFFAPLIFSFASVMLGTAYSPLTFSIIPLHTILVEFIFQKLTRSEVNLLG